MRLSTPRISPLADKDMPDDVKAIFGSLAERGMAFNIFRTMAHRPKALRNFLEWGNYILSKSNSLDERTRELAILRTGYNCRSGYEWAQHVVIGKRCGLTDAEIARIKTGSAAPGWNAADTAILNACDDLSGNHFISDASWAALSAHFTQDQCMDLVFTVGQYTQVSMLLNSFGIQLDPGLPGDPDLVKMD